MLLVINTWFGRRFPFGAWVEFTAWLCVRVCVYESKCIEWHRRNIEKRLFVPIKYNKLFGMFRFHSPKTKCDFNDLCVSKRCFMWNRIRIQLCGKVQFVQFQYKTILWMLFVHNAYIRPPTIFDRQNARAWHFQA